MRRPVRVALALSAVAATAAAAVAVVPTLRSEPGHEATSNGLPVDAEAAVRDLRGAADQPVALVRDAATGVVTSVEAPADDPIDVGSDDPTEAARAFVDRYGDALGAAGTDLVPLSTTPLAGGGDAVRLQQEVDGIPVLGGEASIQLGRAGAVRSTLADLSTSAADVDTVATSTADQARDAALVATVRNTGVDRGRLHATTPEPWIYDPTVVGSPDGGGARLTWRVDIGGPDVDQMVLIDAHTGGAIVSLDQLPAAQQRTVCDGGNERAASPCTADTRVENGPASGVAEVDKAYEAMGEWYRFFWERFGRDSLDGNGMPMRATVRHCRPEGPDSPCPYNNSYFSSPPGTTGSERIVLGDGFVTDDIVGHELTHGLTHATAGLYHWYQSGAIDESFADIFGELIDQTDGIGIDDADVRWLIGEDRGGSLVIRNMLDPTAKGHPDSMTSPAYRTGANDDGGVHANAGVGNRAAALMVDGDAGLGIGALGVGKVARLYYETLVGYLTSGADYAQLAVALRDACGDLVGRYAITFTDCQSVDDAIHAVAMDAEPPNAAWPEAPTCPVDVTAPAALFSDDFETTNSNTWTTQTTAGWAWSSPPPSYGRNATSGILNLWGADTGTPQTSPTSNNFGDASITMASPVFLPANTHPYLRFNHSFGFDSVGGVNKDGGVVEYSTNGGPWTDLGQLFTENGYNGQLNATTTTNPLNGRPAFVDRSLGYTSSRADLSGLAGHNVKIRFRRGEDASVGSNGWFIDDVSIYLCPEPSVSVTQSTPRPSVTVGEVIDLSLNITNTGNVPLTGVTVVDPLVPDCEGPVADIAVGGSRTVACSYTTVDPDDLGTFTNTATVGATQLAGTTASNTVDIPVLAPGSALATLDQAADEVSVDAGEPVGLHLTITNLGNVELTGLVITDAQAPNCAGPVTLPGGAPALPVGAHHTVDCTATPTTPGTWVNAASLAANELTNPTAADDVSVEVLDVTAPTVTITSPADGAQFNLGQAVAADYTCEDDQPTNVASCVGPVDDARSIDTGTPGVHSFAVTGTDSSGNQTTVTHTYTIAIRRPDGRIRQGTAGTTVGNDVVNTTAVGQNRTTQIVRGASVTFFVTVQNDGSHLEAFRVHGQPSTTNYAVQYSSGGIDITTAMRAGTYQTPVLGPGGVRTIKVVVTVGAGAPSHSQVDRLVTSTSANDSSRRDVVRFIVKRR